MSNRRYETEFLLNLLVVARIQGRQKDLEQFDLPTGHACNLYMISRAPRLTIDPDTARFTADGDMLVTLIEQQQQRHILHEIHVRHLAENTEGFRLISAWPNDEFDIIDRNGNLVTGGVVALWFRKVGVLPESLLRAEVLYIGQAFGKAGERMAFDRLRSHSTLQRIYSDATPDMQIWLTLCSIDDMGLVTTMDKPGRVIEKAEAENEAHMVEVYRRYHSENFWTREAVTAAEAGLIRYFQPPYNTIFKDNFPDPSHVHISELYELELHSVNVELQASAVETMFGSQVIAPSDLHFAYYQLGEYGDLFSFLETSDEDPS